MKKKSVFIAIAPNHISNFEQIISNNVDINNTLLLNPGNFEFNKSLWTEVINGSLDLKYTDSNNFNKLNYQLRKLFGYKNYTQKISQHFSGDNDYNFYYCNLDDILTNYIFYYLNKRRKVNNFVVEDGILNYYYPTINSLKLKYKRLLCKTILGIDFIPEYRHPTKIHCNSVISQYVRIPESSICPEKSVKLPFSKIHFETKKDVVLIIGQDIMHNSKEGPNYYKSRLKMLFLFVKEKTTSTTKVVYKPHRNGDFKIAETILKEIFDKVEMYIDVTPIESCITKIKPCMIFSFESSALINLKIATPKNQIAFFVLPFRNEKTELLNLYRNLQIQILPWD